jgi:hypothetical protein
MWHQGVLRVSALSIPEKYQEGVFKISTLEGPIIQSVRDALDSIPVSDDLSPKSTASAVSSLAKEREPARDIRPVIESLLVLYRVKVANDAPLNVFVDDVADALEELEGDYKLPSGQRESFKENLKLLLSSESFTLLTKVRDLQTGDERSFCSAKIYTDLRPVFGANVELGPRAKVLIHTLKLGYHRNRKSNHDEIHISLDESDLHTLRDVADRAIAKAKALREAETGIPLFGVEKE